VAHRPPAIAWTHHFHHVTLNLTAMVIAPMTSALGDMDNYYYAQHRRLVFTSRNLSLDNA
jgi:hypothetical protein